MDKANTKEQRDYKSTSWAVLFLRITISTIVLLHNISKLQGYNNSVENYPTFWGIGGALWFLLIASVEVGCSLLLILGWWTRLAAGVLFAGSAAILVAYIYKITATQIELQGLYSLVYTTLLISGGGLYSLDSLFKK